MKISKKFLLGLGIYILGLLIPGLVLIPKASAIDNTVFDGAKYTLISPGSVQVQLKGLGSEAGPTYTFTDSNPSDSTFNYRYTGTLSDGFVCSLSSNTGITLSGAPPQGPTTITASLGAVLLADIPNNIISDCTNPSKFVGVIDQNIQVTVPSNSGGGTGGGGTTGDSQSSETCEARWSNPLTWIVCPVFNIAAETSNALIDLFKDQLCFKVDTSPTSAAATCEGKITNTSSIKPAWSAIKNIVSALLVIIMLIAIFAEATSIGPIDTYTIRKMLPRLVAAVILIQLSFYIFSWVINVVDDVGEGLSSLLNSIFPGNIDNLNVLLGRANVGDGTAGAVSWLLVAGGVAAAIVAFPTVLMMLFLAIIAILVGLAVLIFRKVLIVALLLIAPVALLLWVLPNTERYWKMWWDNFLKVLLMFPIIVLLIEAGRIFAYVAGPATGGGLIGLFVILVGFFGPLLILPKTYQWGGSLMQLAGQNISKVGGTASAPGKKYFQSRQEGYRAERIRQSQERYSKGVGFSLKHPLRRPLDLMRAGQADPLLWGRRRQQAMTSYAARGAESEEADVKAAEQRLSLMFDEAEDHDKLARDIASGKDSVTGGAIAYRTKSGETRALGKVSMAERQAGLGAVARYGGGTNMRFVDKINDELNNGSEEERVMAEKWRNANSQILLPKMKHVYFGNDRDEAITRLVENGVTESSFTGMDTAEMEAVLSSLSQRANAGDANAAQHLSTVLTSYESAINNPNIRPSIDAGVNKAVEAFVEGGNLDAISASRSKVGLGTIDRSVSSLPQVKQQVARLRGRIDLSGNIRPAAAPPPPQGNQGAEAQPASEEGTLYVQRPRPSGGRSDWAGGPEVPPAPNDQGPLGTPR